MVAQEWDSQTTHIEKQSMHLTALCNTAVDSDVTADRNQHASGLLKFLETDTVCFFEEIPEDLHEMQKEAWTPLVQWFADKHEVHLPTTVSLSNDVPAETLAAAKQRLLDHSDWGAVGYDFAIQVCHLIVSHSSSPQRVTSLTLARVSDFLSILRTLTTILANADCKVICDWDSAD